MSPSAQVAGTRLQVSWEPPVSSAPPASTDSKERAQHTLRCALKTGEKYSFLSTSNYFWRAGITFLCSCTPLRKHEVF